MFPSIIRFTLHSVNSNSLLSTDKISENKNNDPHHSDSI